jgi:hypothetical protein
VQGSRIQLYLSTVADAQLYPNAPPIFSLIDPHNLSADHVKALSKRLGEEAKAMAGQQMVYEV